MPYRRRCIFCTSSKQGYSRLVVHERLPRLGDQPVRVLRAVRAVLAPVSELGVGETVDREQFPGGERVLPEDAVSPEPAHLGRGDGAAVLFFDQRVLQPAVRDREWVCVQIQKFFWGCKILAYTRRSAVIVGGGRAWPIGK